MRLAEHVADHVGRIRQYKVDGSQGDELEAGNQSMVERSESEQVSHENSNS